MASTPTITTSFGCPVGDNEHSSTVGGFGPFLLQDYVFLDKMANFDREVIPERRVHARGAGAHGYFEVTHDVTKYTKAAYLNKVGKQTPVFCRFSTVTGDRGTSEVIRDSRGFSIKHYTEEGNYDMCGLNFPVFFIRDAIKFPDLIHSHKRNPQTNLPDNDMAWDFWGLSPESTHQTVMLFTDRGTPYSYRTMNGYSTHTYKWVNAEGKAVWIKLHYKPEEGVKNFTQAESDAKATDPDHATRDLFNHIASGKVAAWKAYVQVMPLEDAEKQRFSPFDTTKTWSHKDYPLIEYGRLVLNRNPKNYHAETEQAAFGPANLVPGVEASPDGVLQGRLFSYPDTQRHRLGSNFNQIPINCPYATRVANYQRDGVNFGENGGSGPNYWPNSVAGAPAPKPAAKECPYLLHGVVDRHHVPKPEDDFVQPGIMYREVLSAAERDALIVNLAASLKEVTRPEIQVRAIRNFYLSDAEFGTRLASAVGVDIAKVKQ